jgi:solute carrier family 25 (mitochondrial carnitine/acylcarnitine transporter), member 20/29
VKGATAPILSYGALNAILFVTYNRTLSFLDPKSTPSSPSNSLYKVWAAGAVGGLATFVVSAPTELIKCRTQVVRDAAVAASSNFARHQHPHVPSGPTSSIGIAKNIWKHQGLRGLYFGGGVTSIRDAVGYGFYFWSYELSRRLIASPADSEHTAALKVLLYGGIAGAVTWASIFPLDVIKTRVQTQQMSFETASMLPSGEHQGLLRDGNASDAVKHRRTKGALQMAKEAYRNEGMAVFFRGLGICTVRGFIVNAVQFFVYEWMMNVLQPPMLHRNAKSLVLEGA